MASSGDSSMDKGDDYVEFQCLLQSMDIDLSFTASSDDYYEDEVPICVRHTRGVLSDLSSMSSSDDDYPDVESDDVFVNVDIPRFPTEEYLLGLKVPTFRLKACFLRVVLRFGGKRNNIEDGHLGALLTRIRTVFQNEDGDLRRVWVDSTEDDLLSSIQLYEIFSRSSSSRSIAGAMTLEAVVENLNSLLKNIADLMRCNPLLVAPVKEELEATEKSLRFLRNFLSFTAKRCSELPKLEDVVIHAEFLADKMACLLYQCSVNDRMNDQMVNDLKMHLSSELQKFSPKQPEVRAIYIKALKASKSAQGDSAVVDEFDLDFLDSLRDDILELSTANLSFMASDKDQILSLHEEVRVLTTSFGMQTSSEKNAQMSSNLLERIRAAIIDMACLIYSLHKNNEARELKIAAVSDLQESINIAMEDASKARLPEGKKSLTDSSETGSIDMRMRGIEDQLWWLDTNLDLICPLKDEVKALILKAGFLKVFLNCNGKGHIEDGKLKVLFTHIRNVFQSAYLGLLRIISFLNIHISPKEPVTLPMNMDCLLFGLLSRLQHLKPDIQEVYAILSKSSRSSTGIRNEALMENLNALLENIEVLLECNAELVAPLKEEHKAVCKSLGFLRNFLGFTMKRCSNLGKLKDLLIHSEFLAAKMSCLLYLCCDNEKMNDQMVNEMKMLLSSELQKFRSSLPDVREIYFKALKASKSAEGNSIVVDEFGWGFLDFLRDDILELSNANLIFTTCTKDKILFLLEELQFLISFFAWDKSLEEHYEHDLMSSYLFDHINAVIIDTGCAIYSLDEKNEKLAGELELNSKVSELAATMMVTKEDTRKMYGLCLSKSLQSEFPRTNGEGFISSLLRNLMDLLNTKADLVAPLGHNIKIVHKEVSSLMDDFSEIAKQPSQCEELQSQWTRFLDIAYQTEYVIDLFLCGGGTLYFYRLGLFNVVEEIKTIKIELKAIKIKMTDDNLVHKLSQISVEANCPKNNNALQSSKEMLDHVIFGEEAEKIIEQLTHGSKNLNVISIVGMPGIGKTTLANSVFQHSSVTKRFHVQAKCSVSQVHDKRRLLLEILQQVTDESKKYSVDDDDLDDKLRRSLLGRRYLILMDDIWNIQPWKDLKASFPDVENGSRIIFTSRSGDIAKEAGFEKNNHPLSPISKEKSWQMLQVKLFGNRSCPPEFVMVGREIAANCKGLPLTIDLVAGVLQEKETKEWKKVAKSLMEERMDPEGRCQKVIELSYQNLPDDLKPCFLYFAAFPEDANVPTRELILIWIAEGFVKLEEGESKSLEDVAGDILNNLITRSLVTVSRRRPLGGVDASHVHDLLHEFVVAKAQEESFLLKIDGEAKFSTLSSVGVHDQWRKQYRLCIYPNDWRQFLESKPSGPRTRALMCFYYQIEKVLNFRAFKFLRVLHIAHFVRRYCRAMFTLIHLRVLAIDRIEDSNASYIISKIHKLRNLETFITGKYGVPSMEPSGYLLLDEICNMVRLRHFCLGSYISFQYSRMSSIFDNLQTLYHLKLSYQEDIEKILKLMPNLVELKVLFYSRDEDSYSFPKLDFLRKLESLKVIHKDDYSRYPCKIISFPPHLKKLVLSNFHLPWTEISDIGKFEYLEILKLKNEAFEGPIWEMIDGQFPNLKYLSLSCLDIQEWSVSEDHLSCLEQLHVEWCSKLEELPSCLAEITTLEVIRLFHCEESAQNSAMEIKNEQDESRNEELVVDIQRSRFFS